jgi:hypothetical protein
MWHFYWVYTLLCDPGLGTLLWVVDLFIVSYWVAVQHTRLDMSFRYSFWKHNEMGSQSLTVFFPVAWNTIVVKQQYSTAFFNSLLSLSLL